MQELRLEEEFDSPEETTPSTNLSAMEPNYFEEVQQG
jgi:hypothetical protein